MWPTTGQKWSSCFLSEMKAFTTAWLSSCLSSLDHPNKAHDAIMTNFYARMRSDNASGANSLTTLKSMLAASSGRHQPAIVD